MGVDIQALTRHLPADRQRAVRQAYKRQAKHDTTAFLYCFFLGTVGAHRFYLGNARAGMVRLALPVAGAALAGLALLFGFAPWIALVLFGVFFLIALLLELIDLFGVDASVDAYNTALAQRLLAAEGSASAVPAVDATTAPVLAPALGMLTAQDVAEARALALDIPLGMSPSTTTSDTSGEFAPPLVPSAPAAAPVAGDPSAPSSQPSEPVTATQDTTPATPPIWPVDVALGAAMTEAAVNSKAASAETSAEPVRAAPTAAMPTQESPAEDVSTAPLPTGGAEAYAFLDAATAPLGPDPTAPTSEAPLAVRPLAHDLTDQPPAGTVGGAQPTDARPSYVRLPLEYDEYASSTTPLPAAAPTPESTGSVTVRPQARDLTDTHAEVADVVAGSAEGIATAHVVLPPDLVTSPEVVPEDSSELPMRSSVTGPVLPEEAYLTLIAEEAQSSEPVPPEAFVPPSVAGSQPTGVWGVTPPRPPMWPLTEDPEAETAPQSPPNVTPPRDEPAQDNLAELALGLAGGAAAGGLAAEAMNRGHEPTHQQPTQPLPQSTPEATTPEPFEQPQSAASSVVEAPATPQPLVPEASAPPAEPQSTVSPAVAPTSGALKRVRVVRRVVVDGKVVSERVVEEIVPVEMDAAATVAAVDATLGHLTAEQAAQLANLPADAQLELRQKMEVEQSRNTGDTSNDPQSSSGR